MEKRKKKKQDSRGQDFLFFIFFQLKVQRGRASSKNWIVLFFSKELQERK